jgi:hypothetical protein
LCLFWAALAQAAIWPDQFGGFTKLETKPAPLQDKAIWDECGLQEVEQAGYGSGAGSFFAAAFRLKDPTGAFAAFEWQRPADSRPSPIAALSAESGSQLLLAYGNYLLRFDGAKPEAAALKPFLERLPRLERGSLPALDGYLPSSGLIPSSQRYLLGPESLARFAPQIPPSVAAFHLGAEVQLGRFRSKSDDLTLAIFSYPTPQIAMQRIAAFQKLPGVLAKRTGPLIAAILPPGNPDEAEKLLSQVNYQASISWDQYVPKRRDNIGVIVINSFIIVGIMFCFSVVAGLALGGLRVFYRRRLGLPDRPDLIITLGLQDK